MAALGKARLRPRAGANHAPCPAVLNAEGARILDSRARIGQRLPKQFGYKNPAMHVNMLRRLRNGRVQRLWTRRRAAPAAEKGAKRGHRSEEHTSELQSPDHLVC